jgi:hypothetical protein
MRKKQARETHQTHKFQEAASPIFQSFVIEASKPNKKNSDISLSKKILQSSSCKRMNNVRDSNEGTEGKKREDNGLGVK